MKKLFILIFIIISHSAYSQMQEISGTISDTDANRLVGVSVVVIGSDRNTTTDIDGKFKIMASLGETLEISYVGMNPQSITLKSNSDFSQAITLKQSTSLDEVIITAFGVEKEKRKLGYSAQSLNTADMGVLSDGNVINSINSKFTGVQITPTGGGAGAGSNMTIRGYSSISGNNQPLFVVDGVPINNSADLSNSGGKPGEDRDAYTIVRGANRAVDINQFDIESISILKGGAATVMYGVRANNGVVLIKTKQGRKGFNIQFNSSIEFSQIAKAPEFQSRFAQGSGGVFISSNTQNYGPDYADNPVFPEGTVIDLDQNGTLEDVSGQSIPNNSGYYDDFWRTGITNNNTLSFSGGNDKATFYTSLTNIGQESILPNDGYDKNSFLLKGDYQFTDKFKISASSNYISSDLTKFASAYRSPSYALSAIFNPVYNLNDPWKDEFGNTTFYSKTNNKTTPTWIVNEEAEESHINRNIGNINFEYAFSPKLKLNYRIGLDTYNEKRKRHRPISSVFAPEGDIYNVYINSRDINSDFIVSGGTSLMNGDLSVNYLVGNNVYELNYDRSWIYGDRLNLRGFEDISNAKEITVTNSIQRKRIVGVFGQVDFSYKYWLFLELAARNDWSSTLPSDNNSFLYPSASVGFIFSEFIKSEFLDLGKIRFSLAQVGNDAPIYSATNTYYLSETLDGQSAFSVSDESKNNAIKPEISTTWEIGTDLLFLDELVGLNFTYYNRTTKDQVALASLPGSTGYSSYILNAGKIENKGIEATFSLNNIIRNVPAFRWNFAVNFTKNKNTVLEIPEDLSEIIIGSSSWFGAAIIVKPGLPYGSISGTYWETNEAGELYVGDDGLPIKSSDRKVLGDPNPDWQMGIRNGLAYKNLGLDFVFDIKQGGVLLNESRLAMWFYGTDIEIENLGDTHLFEGIVKSTGEVNTQEVVLSENFYKSKKSFIDEPAIEDASWVKLRNVSLSYRLDSERFKNTFIDNLEFAISGRNLWISTDYSGIDPESAAVLGAGNIQSIDMFGVPGTKSYSFSIRANF